MNRMNNASDQPTAKTDRRRFALVLAGHTLLSTLYYALFANVLWMMPLLVRLQFGSQNNDIRDWQTTLVTAAVPTLLIIAIFWGDLLQRLKLPTYLILLWLATGVPLAAVALAQNYWQFLACHLCAAAGFAGWNPLNGKLLKHFYGDKVRGRAFGIMNIVQLASSIAAVYFVGQWLEENPDAFRIFFPIASVGFLIGLILIEIIARRTGVESHIADENPRSWRDLFRPILHMGSVLRADRVFLRYELAFMTYGAAFMFCDALLPVLATDRLGLRYEDYATATQVAMRTAMVIATFPMGWLLDRIGPMRTSGLAFAILGIYPILLLAAAGPTGLGAASAIWGLGLAGVMMGWMLGPVNLAPRPDLVPHYVAIHTTAVGIRGIIFQGVGMALYKITDSFTWPLTLAALAFLWGAWQMGTLQSAVQRRLKHKTPDTNAKTHQRPNAPINSVPRTGPFTGNLEINRDKN